MLGRDHEMTLLRTIYRRAEAERHPDLVTIYGEPGVGKSRLATEFVDWADGLDSPPTILVGRCLPYGDGVTYWPMAEILKGLARIKDDDSTDMALQRIAELGRQLLTDDVTTDPEETTATLAYTVGLEDPEYRVEDRDPREIRAVIHGAWRSFFSALSRQGPVVVIIEDIHWADPALLDLLEHLAERVVGGVMFLCPARPILVERRPGWGGGRKNMSSISLDPLSPEESDSLVGFLLTVDDLPDVIRKQILDQAGGNPFFLEEILRNLIDNGLIEKVEGRWQASSDLADVEIPDTVQGVLAARIDLLDSVEKRILQKAAVVGRVFWPTPVERLLDDDSENVRAAFDRLEKRELVRSQLGSSVAGEPEFIFQHVLTREVAYDSLPRSERGAAHAEVATWIEEIAGERAGEFVELQVYHYQQAYRATLEGGGASPERVEALRLNAFQTTLSASTKAHRRFAVQRAFKLVEQALALAATPTERAQALREKGQAASNDYAGDVAWESLRESADIVLESPPDDPREVARACAFAVEIPTRWPGSMHHTVDTDIIEHYIEAGLAHLPDDDEGSEIVRLLTARAFTFSGWGHSTSGESVSDEVAREAATRATEMAFKLERFDLASAALDALGAVDLQAGRYGMTFDIIERRLKIAGLIKDSAEIGDIFAMAAWTFAYASDYRRGIDLALEGYQRTKSEIGGVRLHNLNWAAYADFWLGNWDRLENETLVQAMTVLGDRVDDAPRFATHVLGVKAMISSIREASSAATDMDRLRRLADLADTETGTSGLWVAWITSRDGDFDAAWDMLEGPSSTVSEPFGDTVRSEIMLDHQRFEHAESFLKGSRAFAAAGKIELLEPHLSRLEGAAALQSGNLDRALGLLEKARAGFKGLMMRWELARTDLLLAKALREHGRPNEARRLAAGALTVFDDMSSIREIGLANQFLDD